MRSPTLAARAPSAGALALGLALLAATTLLAAPSGQAQSEGARREGPTWREAGRGGERARSGGEVRSKGDGGRTRGGERVSRGGDRGRTGGDVRRRGDGGRTRGDDRAYRGGERSRSGGDVRWKGDGGRVRGDDRAYRGGGARWKGDGGRGRVRGGDWRDRDRRHDRVRVYRDAPRDYGGTRYYGGYGPRHYYREWYDVRPVLRRYPRTITYVSFGFGLPYYCPVRYRHVEYRYPVVRYAVEIEVNNLPPAGCYYYDPFCDAEFPDLDSYTEHLDHEGHGVTIEVRDLDSGGWVRTLEFVGGYWVVQR